MRSSSDPARESMTFARDQFAEFASPLISAILYRADDVASSVCTCTSHSVVAGFLFASNTAEVPFTFSPLATMAAGFYTAACHTSASAISDRYPRSQPTVVQPAAGSGSGRMSPQVANGGLRGTGRLGTAAASGAGTRAREGIPSVESVLQLPIATAHARSQHQLVNESSNSKAAALAASQFRLTACIPDPIPAQGPAFVTAADASAALSELHV